MADPNLGKPGEHPGAQSSRVSPERTWSSVLSRNLKPSMDNNVLEVVLEKDTRGSFNVSEQECCNLIRRLGLDHRPGMHVVGVQICPNGRGVIFITLKKDLDIGRYCRYDVLDVTSSGTRAVLVKPAGKREVVVTFRGLHPNTADETVIEYLEKFGPVVTKRVVYGVFSEGPLKGIRNGNRSYKMEVKPSSSLGSYHVLDGQKVSVKYPGQQQTCARCLEAAQHCKGRGVARKCETEGGPKADFNTYIVNLWAKIGYTPNKEPSEHVQEEDDEQPVSQDGGEFTPQKLFSDRDKFTGVVVKNIPKEADHGEVVEYLVQSGLPECKRDDITFSNGGQVFVRDLGNAECLAIIDSIHLKKKFGRTLYCNGFVPLTPEKANHESNNLQESSFIPQVSTASINPSRFVGKPLAHLEKDQVGAGYSGELPVINAAAGKPFPHTVEPNLATNASPDGGLSHSVHAVSSVTPAKVADEVALQPLQQGHGSLGGALHQMISSRADHQGLHPSQQVHGAVVGAPVPTNSSRADEIAPQTLQQINSAGVGAQDQRVGDLLAPGSQSLPDWSLSNTDWAEETDEQFVRRHSVSLNRRTPPRNSLAADILGTSQPQQQPSALASKSLMNSIKDLQDVLSDFKSCNSSSSDEAPDNLKEPDSISTANMSRLKRKKKARSDYSREEFLKKQDTKVSPK